MGKYGQYVGKIELQIGDFKREIKPKVGDGRKFLKIISSAEDNKDALFDKFAPFIFDVVSRDEGELSEEDKQELEQFIDLNLLTFLNETMVAFGMTTRAELDKQKKDMLQAVNKKVNQ